MVHTWIGPGSKLFYDIKIIDGCLSWLVILAILASSCFLWISCLLRGNVTRFFIKSCWDRLSLLFSIGSVIVVLFSIDGVLSIRRWKTRSYQILFVWLRHLIWRCCTSDCRRFWNLRTRRNLSISTVILNSPYMRNRAIYVRYCLFLRRTVCRASLLRWARIFRCLYHHSRICHSCLRHSYWWLLLLFQLELLLFH